MRPVVVDRDDAGGDAVEHRFDVAAAAFDVLMLALELDRRALEPPPAGGQVASHAVERLDQRAELVARLRLDAVIEVAGADLVGRRGQHLHRPRDALGQVEPHPRGADENHQRQHQEEREIDAGQRLLAARAAAGSPRRRRSCRAPARRTGRSGIRSAITTPRTGPPGDERIGTAVRIRSPPPGSCSTARCSAPPARRSLARGDPRTRASTSRGIDGAATSRTGTTGGRRLGRRARPGRPRPDRRVPASTSGADEIAHGGGSGGCEVDAAQRARQALRLRRDEPLLLLVVVAGDSRWPTTALRPSAR